MKKHFEFYTPYSIIKLILNYFHREQYNEMISGHPSQQIFPPLPTGDEVLKSLSEMERHIIHLKIRATSRFTEGTFQDFLLECLLDITLKDVVNCAFNGDPRPIFFCLHSPAFRDLPALPFLIEDYINGNLKMPKGRKFERDRWKYFFARCWLEIIEGYRPDSAMYLIGKFFVKSRSTVNKRSRELRNTDDGMLMLAVVENAKAYPEMQEYYLDTYCKEFKGLFGRR